MRFIWRNLASDLFSLPFVIITATEILLTAFTAIECNCRRRHLQDSTQDKFRSYHTTHATHQNRYIPEDPAHPCHCNGALLLSWREILGWKVMINDYYVRRHHLLHHWSKYGQEKRSNQKNVGSGMATKWATDAKDVKKAVCKWLCNEWKINLWILQSSKLSGK